MAARGARAAAGDAGDRVTLGCVADEPIEHRLRAFRQGLKEAATSRARTWRSNTASLRARPIGCRSWRPTSFIAPVTVIAAVNTAAALAAKAATTTIPIVFVAGDDPVRLGLVASLARPGGNIQVSTLSTPSSTAKRLELLRELVPSQRVAVLVDPNNATATKSTLRDVEPARPRHGTANPSCAPGTSREIDAAFATVMRERPTLSSSVPLAFFASRRIQHCQPGEPPCMPAIYADREFAEVGGLMSYGTNLPMHASSRRLCRPHPQGRPSPPTCRWCRPPKFELVINLKTAKALGLEIPPTLLARADEVIE